MMKTGRLKRISALVLCLSMVLGMLSISAGADTAFRFTDDTGSGTWSWAGDYIYDCYEAGVLSGYEDGSFLPDNSLTRAEAAKIIASAVGLEIDGDAESSFSDVADSHWASPYIEACVEAGIISGYADGTYLPGQNVTRAEIAKMIAVAVGLDADSTEDLTSTFADVSDTHWALKYIEACVDAGIITGMTSTTFEPSSNVTRAQAAAMISRALAMDGDEEESSAFDLSAIPEYSGDPYVTVNGNVPDFDEDDLTTVSFETYSELDSLGRCGVAYACIGTDLMPTEERGSISSVTPTGWHSVTYDIVDGGYLYNRCHLIGYQLTAENANERNLITGTRYLNVDGMLPFENMVADYIEETGNHVLYRVTPVFEGDNLVASGVQIEAMSVEDNGEGILFNVYCYNVQPGITIDYATGDSWLSDESGSEDAQDSTDADSTDTGSTDAQDAGSTDSDDADAQTDDSTETTYILNTSTMKFHYPDCSSVSQMSEENKLEYTGTREEVIAMGYDPCGRCNP